MTSLTNPRQTVLITCRDRTKNRISGKEEIKDNIMTIDWHMPTSFKPVLYAISIGKTRFSCNMIRNSKVFCVNFMPFHLAKEVLFCGRNTGEHIDKFKKSGLTKEESITIDCPRIKESCGFMECEVINELETGDHIIFIGRVVSSEIKEDAKRVFHTEGDNFTTTKD